MIISPLFPVVYRNNGFFYRVKQDIPLPTIHVGDQGLALEPGKSRGLSVHMDMSLPGRVVKTAVDAENEVFALALRTQTFDSTPPNTSPTWMGGCSYVNPFMLMNRCANMIAARTRRSTGNLAFMRRSAFDTIMLHGPVTPMSVIPEQPIGRWHYLGDMNHTIRMYVTDDEDFPEGRIIICLANGMDAPAHLIEWNGQTHISVMQSTNYSVGNPVDYLQRIDFI
jgi:hypothetical protein